ncbi:hypothetical protein, conserved [Trypanosoma brucei gambiense DAL972]|uniref:Uncharacterized protein n=2 Tax=Trypanosoma brucei TaxID=5691 RepID=C9ZQQ9_TRYB9|nr:hypothetical protein, conserved [Trypanosoma brucei gambiense DAL972]RHW72102.1 hypothetical protein DPX39_060027000 [Trypanosoma brucei equiperdum]CBH11739.1 hypothetical protein, conserved [Trypanosoma brucei gambiense DAL972]|eukprot:XP_011774024.1 hypothetical protein, conserved [Trypanosoma brucei gambiense DAL972]
MKRPWGESVGTQSNHTRTDGVQEPSASAELAASANDDTQVRSDGRNVRVRSSGSPRTIDTGNGGGSTVVSPQRQLSDQRLPQASSRHELLEGTSEFLLRTEGNIPCSFGNVPKDSIGYESQCCWNLYNNTGTTHYEPPWRTCLAVEKNRENPYYLPWLDSMKIPPLDELLSKVDERKSKAAASGDVDSGTNDSNVKDGSTKHAD